MVGTTLTRMGLLVRRAQVIISFLIKSHVLDLRLPYVQILFGYKGREGFSGLPS